MFDTFEERLVSAIQCVPPHRVTHPEKLNELISDFKRFGWNNNKPKLIGYWFRGKIQLITGSHRWFAAEETQTQIPVKIYDYAYIESIWGTDKWVKLIQENT